MTDTYRDPNKTYRDLSLTYRGGQTFQPGVDLEIQDYINMYLMEPVSGEIVAPLNASSLQSVQWDLNDSGSATIYLNQLDPAVATILAKQAANQLQGPHFQLRVGASPPVPRAGMSYEILIVFVTSQGLETFCGFPMRVERKPMQKGGPILSLEGMFSKLKLRIIESASLMYTSEDQFDIGWSLVNTAQTYQPYYDLRITASYQPSGIIRSRFYDVQQHQTFYDLIQQFDSTKLQQGFDFDLVTNFDGTRNWNMYYPARGVVSPYTLEWGGGELVTPNTIIDYDLQDDISQMMTKCYCVGGGQGGVQFEQSYEDVTASQEWGALVGTFSQSNELDLTWLAAVAQNQVTIRKQPIPNYQVVVGVDFEDPLVGRVHPGDMVHIKIDDGATQENAQYRVKSIGWQKLPQESFFINFLQPNLQGYTDPMAQEPNLPT